MYLYIYIHIHLQILSNKYILDINIAHHLTIYLTAAPSRCIQRDGGLSTVHYSCRLRVYLSEEGVQKTFPDPGYLRSAIY